ncbi:MAG TPA: hypothetical protein VFA38_05675 [Nitrospirales bacterium]|nr:hypothetical protein [Nitrospirales bacterium]
MLWLPLNIGLASAVAAFGFWLVWPETAVALLLACAMAAVLYWRAGSIAMVWVWTTALVGLESLAWPVITMVQLRALGPEPTPEQMGTILTALVGGLLSSIFWLTFAYGLYRRTASDRAL